MAAPPWQMDWGNPVNPNADPYRIQPDPILAQRAAEEEERKRQDQILQQQQAAIQAQAAAAAQDKAMRDRQEWLATHNPDGSPIPQPTAAEDGRKSQMQNANLDALVNQINRVQELFNSGQRDNAIPLLGSLYEYLPTQENTQFDAAAAGMAEQGLAAFRVPGVGAQSDTELRQFVEANKPSTWSNDSSNLERLRQLRTRVDATRAALGLPKAEWTGLTDETAREQGLERHMPGAPNTGAGGSSGPPTGGGSNFLSQLGDATQNAIAGVAQGAAGAYDFPMGIANSVNEGMRSAIAYGGGAILDTLNMPQAADWWRQAPRNIPAYNSVSDLIERASPTPQGMEAGRFTSQVLGGMAVPLGPKAAPKVNLTPRAMPANNAREIIDLGAQNNVRVMTSDVRPPSSFVGKSARALGERIPYAGTGGPRAAQQAERVEAVRDLAREFSADAGIDYLDQVADDFAKTRGARIGALTKQKNAVIDGNMNMFTAADAPRTIAAIEQQITRLAGINEEKFAPVIRELSNLRNTVTEGKLLSQIEGNRRILGGLFDDPGLAGIKDDGQKAINAIYAPLRDDMASFIKRTAGPDAHQRWASANQQLAQMAGQLDDTTFRNVLNSAEATPENVARLLFSKKPSDVRRLMGSLSPAGRERAQSAIIARAFEQASGAEGISPDVFANTIGKLGSQMGVVFNPTDLARVNGLARLINSTKQASVASAAPPTGVQNSVPILAAVLTDLMGTMGGALASGGIAGLSARLYESAPVRNLLVGMGKTKPGSPQESRVAQRLAKVIMSQSQIQSAAMQQRMMQSLDRAPGRLAAQDQEND